MDGFKPVFKGWVNTIQDMERLYYGLPDEAFIEKADAPIRTDTTGARNIVYGSQLWVQVITAANQFGLLPKKPWSKSGYRAVTAAASTASAGQSQYDNAVTLPDTIKPTFAVVDITPKILAAFTEESSLELALESSQDDTTKWAEVIDYMGQEFQNRVNRGLMTDNDTLAGTNIESIDRIIASNAEIAACGQTASDLDIYGMDRDAGASWTDAYVAHGSNTDRDFALPYLDALFTNCRPYWNSQNMGNKVLVTGFDTAERLEQILQSQQIFSGVSRVSFSVNGVSTVEGQEAGMDVVKYKGAPIIPDPNCVQDTLSRIYLEDLDFLWVGMLTPIQYLESEDYIAMDKFARMGGYFMQAEVVNVKFKCHGKVRDLK